MNNTKRIHISSSITGESEKKIVTKYVSNTITDAFWADGNSNRMTLPPYDKNSVKILFAISKAGFNSRMNIKVYAKKLDKKALVYETNFTTIESARQLVNIELTGSLFKKGESMLLDNELILNLFFELTIKGDKFSNENDIKSHLRFHYVRFIPQILKNKEWLTAKMFQDKWFSGSPSSSEPWRNAPKIDFIEFDWVRKFDRMKNAIDNLKEKIFTNNSKARLLKMLSLMVESGDLFLPALDQTVKFGVDSNKIINHEVEHPKLQRMVNEKMPHFEKYYFQSIPYSISKNIFSLETLDDCFGALAACQFRAVAMGTVTRKKDVKLFGNAIIVVLDIHINEVKIYIKDSFDFIGNDEKLGVWDAEANEISIKFGSGYTILNKYYNDWKKDYNSGQDYHLYSTLETHRESKTYKNAGITIFKRDDDKLFNNLNHLK